MVGGVQTILFDRPLSFSTGHWNGRGRTCEPLFRNRPPSSPLLSVWPLIKWGKPFSSVHVHSFKTRFCPSYVDGMNPYCSFTEGFCDIRHTQCQKTGRIQPRQSRHFTDFTPRATNRDWWREGGVGESKESGAHSFPLSFLLYLATPPPLVLVVVAVATLALLHFSPLSLIAIRNPIPRCP